ncbi:hypothetical protein L195_g037949 [Trifolium pratense]|uniref:Uncharacterized protein n=2 Tax=Trifolium pratense TaxID=57577 RepID=A0ACB0JCU2_TRIPR|nr:hypothetical protein L195_g037949 [Trifolium pratense]CAJ2641773.1 unnamed protein product [Trifolium pratense]
MENLQEQLDVLRSDVNQMAIKLDRVLEVLTNLNLLPQHVLGSNAAAVGANPSTGLSSSNVIWPPDGLPVGCTSSRYTHPSNEGPAAAQVIQAPMGTNAEFFASQPRAHQVLPRVVVPQKSQDSPKNVYQSSGMMTVDPGANFANVHVGETHQKLREIMDKLSNVSKVQFCSSMPVHTSYSQQPQGCPFPKAMQMPMNPTPQRTQQQPRRVLDPIPMTYSQLLPYLVHSGMVTPKAPKPMTPPFPAWYDAKTKCEFHAGTEGHSIDNCKTFRYKVQELIDKQLLTFKEGNQNISNESANSFTKKKEGETNAIKVFDLIPMSYGQLLPYLVDDGMVTPRALKPMTPPFPAWYDDKARCEFHMGAEGHSIDNCRAFKHLVQELIDGKFLTFKDGKPSVKDSPLPDYADSSARAV